MPAVKRQNIDTLTRLRHRYRHVLTHVDMACRDTDGPLCEEHLWHLIARTASPPWAAAYAALQTAQLAINRLNRDDNRPLGAIGRALAATETDAAETAFATALSRFTSIDERLRALRHLQLLLDDVKNRYNTLERSQGISEAIFALTLDAQRAAPSLDAAPVQSGLWARLFKPGQFYGLAQKSQRGDSPAIR